MSDEQCSHKCHTVGLNPWILACPICGCQNPGYDAKSMAPRYLDSFLPNPTTTDLLANSDRELRAGHERLSELGVPNDVSLSISKRIDLLVEAFKVSIEMRGGK